MMWPNLDSISKIVRGEKRGDERIIRFKVGLLVRYLFSCLIDADRINSADLERPRAAKVGDTGNMANGRT